jgi:DNA-binding PadR family transcriptional regulator
MSDRPRSVDRLLPLKPKVLHILLALADGPRHGYSIMQEVAARTDGQVRVWPAPQGTFASRRPTDRGVEKRPGDDERRRYFALTPLGKPASGEAGAWKRLSPSTREPSPAQGGTRMNSPSSPFDSAGGKRAIRAYGRLLWLLRGRDPQDQRAIKEDAELLLDAARARGRGTFAATWLALMWDLVIVGAGHDLTTDRSSAHRDFPDGVSALGSALRQRPRCSLWSTPSS